MVEGFAEVLGDEVAGETRGEALDDGFKGAGGGLEGLVVADVGEDYTVGREGFGETGSCHKPIAKVFYTKVITCGNK